VAWPASVSGTASIDVIALGAIRRHALLEHRARFEPIRPMSGSANGTVVT